MKLLSSSTPARAAFKARVISILKRPGYLLDRMLIALEGELTWRKAAIIVTLIFFYSILALRFVASPLRRFFIVAFEWPLETAVFWSQAALFGVPVLLALTLWIHKGKLWHLVVEALCLFGFIFTGFAMWGLLTKFTMVEDLGFFRAYGKWISGKSEIIFSIVLLIALTVLRIRARRNRANVSFRPAITPIANPSPPPIRRGRMS